MKIGIADLPWPFLAEPRVIAQNGAGTWHDLHSLMSEAGLGAPEATNIAATLSRLSALGSSGRKKLERALGSTRHPVVSPVLAAPIDPHLFDGAPLAIDSVEWFASPRDMARTFDWLRRVDDPAVRAILAINPGMPPSLATRFAYAGFKGGSEPGVLALNYLLHTKSGQWYALAANWHDPARAVSEFDFASLVNRALALIPQ